MRLRMKLVMVKWKETLGNGIKRIEIFSLSCLNIYFCVIVISIIMAF